MKFLKAHELYKREFLPNPKTVKIGEHKIPLPKEAPDELCVNFGLPKHEQKFIRNQVPIDIRMWSKKEEEEYVRAEWHKRLNGIWMFINGRKYYFPGSSYLFFNYWHTDRGGLPEFRMEALEFFLFWEYCKYDPDCLGMVIVKPRRIGDTEKVLCIIYDETTRWKFSYSGMQNYNGEQAKKNFKRVVASHDKMVYFFKPKTRGTDNPEKVLEFRYPEEKLSARKTLEKEELALFNLTTQVSKGLESKIDYANTVIRAYDGSRQTVNYIDEIGKIKTTDMDVEEQWQIVSKTLTLNNDVTVIGKGIMTNG